MSSLHGNQITNASVILNKLSGTGSVTLLDGSSFKVVSSTGSNIFYIGDSGNIGIGTASPNALIHSVKNVSTISNVTTLESTKGSVDVNLEAFTVSGDTSGGSRIFFRTSGVEYGGISTSSANSRFLIQSDNGYDLYLNNDTTAQSIYLGSGGIYFTTTSQRMYISDAGDIGIGVNPALARLHVKGSTTSSASYAIKVDDLLGNSLLSVRNDGNVGVGIISPSAKLDIYNQVPFSNTSNTFIIGQNYTFVGMQYMTFGQGGRLAVGVDGSTLASGAGHHFWAPYAATEAISVNTNTGNTLFRVFTSGDFEMGSLSGPLSNFKLTTNQFIFSSSISDIVVGINTITPSANLHVKGATSSPSYVLKVDDYSNNNLFSVGIDGNVGINTAPSTKLHVYATQSGAFRLQDTTQLSGYALISDANGVGTWQSIATAIPAGSINLDQIYGTGSLILQSGAILRTPTSNISYSTDIVNKEYVDSLAAGLKPKASVKTVANTEIDLITATVSPYISGYTMSTNDRILVWQQSVTASNGVYVYNGPTASPAFSRSSDMDGNPNTEVQVGVYTFATDGTDAGDGYVIISSGTYSGILTPDVDPIVWSEFMSSPGVGTTDYVPVWTSAGKLSSTSSISVSLDNVGIGVAPSSNTRLSVKAKIGEYSALFSSGPVLWGDSSPVGALSYNGSNAIVRASVADLELSAVGNITSTSTGTNVGIGISLPTAKLHIQGSGNTSLTNTAIFQNSSLTQSLVIRDDGNISIGSSVGVERLSVYGTVISNSQIRLSSTVDTVGAKGLRVSSRDGVNEAFFGFYDAGPSTLGVSIGSLVEHNVIGMVNDKDIVLMDGWDVATGSLGAIRFNTGGYSNGSRMIIDEVGRLGLGVSFVGSRPTIPLTSLMTIGGTASMVGFQLYTGATAGKVLTSDINGNGTWQSAGTASGIGTVNKYISQNVNFIAGITQSFTHSLSSTDIVVQTWDDSTGEIIYGKVFNRLTNSVDIVMSASFSSVDVVILS